MLMKFVHKSYTDNQETERKLVEELNEKYKQVSLNPETGVFTPFQNQRRGELKTES